MTYLNGSSQRKGSVDANRAGLLLVYYYYRRERETVEGERKGMQDSSRENSSTGREIPSSAPKSVPGNKRGTKRGSTPLVCAHSAAFCVLLHTYIPLFEITIISHNICIDFSNIYIYSPTPRTTCSSYSPPAL
jgi:hypothetical protein